LFAAFLFFFCMIFFLESFSRRIASSSPSLSFEDSAALATAVADLSAPSQSFVPASFFPSSAAAAAAAAAAASRSAFLAKSSLMRASSVFFLSAAAVVALVSVATVAAVLFGSPLSSSAMVFCVCLDWSLEYLSSLSLDRGPRGPGQPRNDAKNNRQTDGARERNER
jgi:hypothetical protein